MPAINALCFATIVHQAGLVPRWIPTVGLIGAPMLLVSSMITLFGGFEQFTVASMLMALPIATWELPVGIYMAVKGFRTPVAGAPTVDHVTVPATGSPLTHA